MEPTRYCVRITYPRGLGPVAYLSHRNRSTWTRRTARKHAADIRAGRTGIRGFTAVDVMEA
jgi:hypothetical protein